MKTEIINDYAKQLLKSEDYIPIPEDCKNSLQYKIAYNVKEKIREHKWNKGTENIIMTWDEVVEDWMKNYYKLYVNFIQNEMWPEKHLKKMYAYKSSTASSRFGGYSGESFKPFHLKI